MRKTWFTATFLIGCLCGSAEAQTYDPSLSCSKQATTEQVIACTINSVPDSKPTSPGATFQISPLPSLSPPMAPVWDRMEKQEIFIIPKVENDA